MEKRIFAAFLGAAILATVPASAQLTFIPAPRPTEPVPMTPSNSSSTPSMTTTAPMTNSTGRYSAPNDQRPATGFGDNIPLSIAMMQIVPPPWRIDLPRAYASKPVSWRGGDAWPTVAEATLRAAGLEPEWQSGHLYARVAAPEAVSATTPFTPAAAAAAPTQPSAPAATAAETAPPRARGRTWKVEPGTYQATMREWAKQAGWNIVLLDPDVDYAIEVPASFEGDFVAASRSLARAFRNVSRPPALTFHCETVSAECSTQTVVVRSSSSREN